MKRILALALCALFALNAEARTLYVDASRPNNNGNGRSSKTAKKTLQAAINIARKGDTIIVAPGSYSSITTNNKKIRIKAKNGSAKTTIFGKKGTYKTKKYPSSVDGWGSYTMYGGGAAIAKLGREISKSCHLLVTKGKYFDTTVRSAAITKGNATTLSGFTLDGKQIHCGDYYHAGVLVSKSKPTKRKTDLAYAVAGVSGGTVVSCVLKNCGNAPIAVNSKLSACKIMDNASTDGGERGIESSTFSRCTFTGNDFRKSSSQPYSCLINADYLGGVNNSKFDNCLFATNAKLPFFSCSLVNCTVADNSSVSLSKIKAYNTIFYKVSASQFKKAKKNTLKNCYKGSNPKFVSTENDDYRLAVGSPCLDKGTNAKAAKKLYGKKDLAGNKRVQGKSVDIGCYEGAFDVSYDWDDGDLDHGVY